MRRKPLARSPMKHGTTRLKRRAPMPRGRRRVGQAAAERRAAGGKRAVGRHSLPALTYRALVAGIYLDADWRCEYPRCRRRTQLTPNHVPKVSQPGARDDRDHIVAACLNCHHATDNLPHDDLRYVAVTPVGDETFDFRYADGVTIRYWRRRPDRLAPRWEDVA